MRACNPLLQSGGGFPVFLVERSRKSFWSFIAHLFHLIQRHFSGRHATHSTMLFPSNTRTSSRYPRIFHFYWRAHQLFSREVGHASRSGRPCQVSDVPCSRLAEGVNVCCWGMGSFTAMATGIDVDHDGCQLWLLVEERMAHPFGNLVTLPRGEIFIDGDM
jgi:hypothetical protein